MTSCIFGLKDNIVMIVIIPRSIYRFNEFSINISTAFGISVCGAQFLTENDFVDKNRASPIWVRN